MSSSARVLEVHGSRFGAAVPAPSEVTATAPAAKPSLPDQTFAVLMELQGSTPAEKKEWNDLVSERHTLNLKTIDFITRQLAARHADLERRDEAAKCAVREQGAVIEKLNQSVIDEGREFLQADNARRLASAAAHDAEVNLKGLSRFASKAEVASAEKRVTEANKKLEVAQAKAAEWGQHLNYLKTVTVPAEQKKLTELIEKEMELAAQLEGRDAVLAKFGFMQR